MPDRAAIHRDSPHLTAWLLVFALAFVWLFPMLLVRGMSLDGVIYATVARNLAVGIGDPWHLAYTATHHTWPEAPPLGLLLQSLFFRFLGDQWWVERLYSVATVVPTGLILVLIWRHLFERAPRLRAFAWLPIGLWVSLPAWPWIYRNNYLENTLGIFTALAVYGSLRAMAAARWWPAWSALAAGSILAAVLSKGPVGMFPAVTPAVIWLTLRGQSVRKSLLVQITLLVFLAAAVGLILAESAPREFLSAYVKQQIVNSLQGRRETVDSPLGQLALLWTLCFQDLLPCGLLAGGSVLWARWRRAVPADLGLRGATWFCLLTAASASIPIMISPKQSAYYAAPSWPFYTMALALWCLPSVDALITQATARATSFRATRWLRATAACAIGLVVAISPLWAGTMIRDRQIIQDVERIARFIEPHTTLVAAPEMENEWSLQAYLYRLHYISVKVTAGECPGAYRLDFANSQREVPSSVVEDSNLTLYRLYKPASITALPNQTTPAR